MSAPTPVDAGPPAPTPAVAPSPPQPLLVPAFVLELGGGAEVKRAGTEEWVTLKIGEPIRVGDAVRTKGEGELELSIGEVRMKVHENSELTLTVLQPKVVHAQVKGSAEAKAAGTTVEMEGEGSGAVASASDGKLSMYADGKGTAAAAALEGAMKLTEGGESVDLKSGQFSAVRSGRIAKSRRIPKKVSVHVAWPEQTETNRTTLSLHGTASEFARVLVQGHRVDSNPDGTFVADVVLKRGKQRVSIAAVDPLGRRAVESRVIIMDPQAPDIRGQVEYR